MHRFKFTFILVLIGQFLIGQNADPVLFTVEDHPVGIEEFNYIYNKNNGDKADYSEQSLSEYLDLYINFKLKVQRAREMKLDTIKSLQRELEGYRKQLASAYLVDNEVSDQLIKEVYDRKQKDLKVAHILVASAETDTPEQQQMALEKIKAAQKLLERGGDFAKVANEYSEDPQSAKNGGSIGYITSMLPKGFYNFESAVYNTPVGKMTDIVQTAFGYHIGKVLDSREARGEMEIAHLLIRKKYKGQEVPNAKMKIDSIYTALKAGANFEEMCKAHSQDSKTQKRGGYLGNFGINRYEMTFEDGAFSLTEDNQFSKPIETQVGYHIIKRISKKDLKDFTSAQKRLKRVVSNSQRFGIAREALIESIKEEGKFEMNETVYNQFKNSLKEDFFSFKWEIPTLKDQDLFSFSNGQKESIKSFAAFCKKESKTRLRFGDKKSPGKAADKLLKDFVTNAAIKFEESTLENKYPEFKALMREYREGILLFEATEREVWNKASEDTVGLEKFYAKSMDKYQWSERAKVIEYNSNTSNAKQVKKLFKYAKKNDTNQMAEAFKEDKLKINFKELVINKDDERMSKFKKWKVGEVSEPDVNVRDNLASFYKIVEILPAGQKELSEARGYVISDFQDSLEKSWIKTLREKYEIVINQDVFKSLIK